MNVGNIFTADCVDKPLPPDSRCSDPAFALANPALCPVAPFLLIKPSVALMCVLGCLQFKAFYVKDGKETDVTNLSLFTSSNTDILVIGASSGGATALSIGNVLVTASYLGLTAQAQLDVIGAGGTCSCCDNTQVAMMVAVDNSRSMSLQFAGMYASRLAFAKAAANRFISEVNQTKDLIGLLKFNADDDTVLSSPVSNKNLVQTFVNQIPQTQSKTTFYDALTTAISELNATSANLKVLVLISDGEDTTTSYLDFPNPIALLSDFKSNGGIVICVGCRASGEGFAFLSNLATGGFFINAYPSIEVAALNLLSGLKGYICAGNCTPAGDVIANQGKLNYTAFANWNVVGGFVDLQGNCFFDYLSGNGLYVDLISGTQPSGADNGQLVSKTPFSIKSGHSYRISVDLAGNQIVDRPPDTARVQLYYRNSDTDQTPIYLIDQQISISDYRQDFHTYSFAFTAPADHSVYIAIQQEDHPQLVRTAGLLLNRVKLDDLTDLTNLLDDTFDTENPVYVPPRCGMGTTYVSGASITGQGNQIPLMTGNSSPSGKASASTSLLPPYLSFNRNNSDGWASDAAVNNWLQYQFPAPMTVNRIRYQIGLSGAFIPDVTFELSGSNDGVNFTPVHNRAEGAQAGPTLTTVDVNISPVTYSYFRLTAFMYSNVINANVPYLELLGPQTTIGYGYLYGYCCYGAGCLSSPPPSQLTDPFALPDIESGTSTGPKTFTSTKTACATCPDGTSNTPSVNLIPAMTSDIVPSGIASASSNSTTAFQAFDGDSDFSNTDSTGGWRSTTGGIPAWLQYKFPSAAVADHYSITVWKSSYSTPKDFKLQGSQDGSNWTDLDTRTGINWFSGETKAFQFTNTTAYIYYRLSISATIAHGSNPDVVVILEMTLSKSVPAQVCKSATATSKVSQADADNQAYAAALALAQAELNCQQSFSSTEQFTATCPIGSFGLPVTKSASATSLVSQAEANAAALADATAQAQDALDCSLSNNDQKITINDSVGGVASATPFPSVKHVTGAPASVSKVTVTLKGFSHTNPDDVLIMLLHQPTGRTCYLLANAGGTANVVNADIVFDDAAGSQIPDSGPMVAGTFQCSAFLPAATLPAPAPAGPYGANLSVFNGIDGNGSWAIFTADDTSLDSGQIALGWDITIT